MCIVNVAIRGMITVNTKTNANWFCKWIVNREMFDYYVTEYKQLIWEYKLRM